MTESEFVDRQRRLAQIADHIHRVVLDEARKADAFRDDAMALVLVAVALLDNACLIDNVSSQRALDIVTRALHLLEPDRLRKRKRVLAQVRDMRASGALEQMLELLKAGPRS